MPAPPPRPRASTDTASASAASRPRRRDRSGTPSRSGPRPRSASGICPCRRAPPPARRPSPRSPRTRRSSPHRATPPRTPVDVRHPSARTPQHPETSAPCRPRVCAAPAPIRIPAAAPAVLLPRRRVRRARPADPRPRPRSPRRRVRPFLPVRQPARRLLRHREPLHALDPHGLARSQVDDRHAVLRHLRRRLLLSLGFLDLSPRRERREHDRPAVRRKLDHRPARLRRRFLFAGGCRRLRTLARRLPLLLARNEIANDDLAIAFLREHPVREPVAIRRKLLPDNGAPAVVIVMIERPLGRLGEEQQRGGQKARRKTEHVAVCRHNAPYCIARDRADPSGRSILTRADLLGCLGVSAPRR